MVLSSTVLHPLSWAFLPPLFFSICGDFRLTYPCKKILVNADDALRSFALLILI